MFSMGRGLTLVGMLRVAVGSVSGVDVHEGDSSNSLLSN